MAGSESGDTAWNEASSLVPRFPQYLPAHIPDGMGS